MALKIGGKDAKATAKPLPPPTSTIAPVAIPRDFRDPYADPFPAPDVTDPALAASWLAEAGLFTQQWIEELARLARKLDKLKRKLQRPDLANDPHRPDAIRKARAMEVDLIDLVRDVSWEEALASRTWMALTPEQRTHANAHGHWHTPPETPHLIGAAFLRIGLFETWPLRFQIRRIWMEPDMPYRVVLDMRAAGVFNWQPTPYTGPEPFGDESERMPMDIARQIEGRR